ncbi:hypothetical protein NB311A_07283 [Nitrobacter sp. Nb-311A]|nr:hypothetical protein NB311A_07283 [Nitrobacter sp. Nb-311A]
MQQFLQAPPQQPSLDYRFSGNAQETVVLINSAGRHQLGNLTHAVITIDRLDDVHLPGIH